jgi:uncharacterized membrane protein YccC
VRFLKTVFWLIVAVVLVTVGLANRGIVTLRVLPEALSGWLGVSPDVDLPLFLVILAGVALGLGIGFIWEWIREIPERAAARNSAREIARLQAEIRRQKAEASKGDVLAGLDLPALPRR